MTHRNETLSEQIELLVRSHIDTTRREASEAVARAFGRSTALERAFDVALHRAHPELQFLSSQVRHRSQKTRGGRGSRSGYNRRRAARS